MTDTGINVLFTINMVVKPKLNHATVVLPKVMNKPVDEVNLPANFLSKGPPPPALFEIIGMIIHGAPKVEIDAAWLARENEAKKWRRS